MVVLPIKMNIKTRTVDIRRLGVKIRTYENARVFLYGTAGRGSSHWAIQDFKDCLESSEEITYFSGNNKEIAIACHGDHTHVISREREESLDAYDAQMAEKVLLEFLEKLRQRGVIVELEKK